MPVKFYLGRDQQGRPHSYTFTHEESGARHICQYMYDRLDRNKETYALVANPCYTGSFLELNPDIVIISEMGLGVIELKHHFGEVDCSDPAGPWHAGGTIIEAGRGFSNPHTQVQSYAEQIRNELIVPGKAWLPGTALQQKGIKIHTTICFTNPFARLEKCREAVQYRYNPGRQLRAWEKFSITTAAEIPNWAADMRFEVMSEADWFKSYELLPGEVFHLATDFFHAREWQEIEDHVRQVREPFGYLALIDPARSVAQPPFRIDREEMWIGRNAGTCNIVIPQYYTLTSNRHARLIYTNHRYYIEDLGSTNGTYLPNNPERLSGIVELKPNDRILLGDSQPGDKVCALELRVEKLFANQITEQIH